MAGCEINSVFAGIAGAHITGFNSQGVIAIKNREVTSEDVQRVIDAAKAIAIPMDRESDPCHSTGIYHRRSGRHQGAARHERGASGVESAYRHRRGGQCPEYCQKL